MMAPVPRLTVRVAATPAGLQLAAAEFNRFLAEHQGHEAGSWPLQVALDEILSNIVHHATAGQEAGFIDIAVALRDDAVELMVSDDGPAFDPLQLPEPRVSAPLEDRGPGGLGVHLVRRLMDRVEYRRDGGRNCLVMTWRPGRPVPRAP
jgi:serine/threonine-protein kinase RsbW